MIIFLDQDIGHENYADLSLFGMPPDRAIPSRSGRGFNGQKRRDVIGKRRALVRRKPWHNDRHELAGMSSRILPNGELMLDIGGILRSKVGEIGTNARTCRTVTGSAGRQALRRIAVQEKLLTYGHACRIARWPLAAVLLRVPGSYIRHVSGGKTGRHRLHHRTDPAGLLPRFGGEGLELLDEIIRKLAGQFRNF